MGPDLNTPGCHGRFHWTCPSQELPGELTAATGSTRDAHSCSCCAESSVLCLANICKGFLKQQWKKPSLPGAVAVGRTQQNPTQPLREDGTGSQICKPPLRVPTVVMCLLSMLCVPSKLIQFHAHPGCCSPWLCVHTDRWGHKQADRAMLGCVCNMVEKGSEPWLCAAWWARGLSQPGGL